MTESDPMKPVRDVAQIVANRLSVLADREDLPRHLKNDIRSVATTLAFGVASRRAERDAELLALVSRISQVLRALAGEQRLPVDVPRILRNHGRDLALALDARLAVLAEFGEL